MASEYGYTESFKAARESQQKFDYFFLGVILATLSLGIQTNISGPTIVCKYLLVLSWSSWLVSFLAGFFRQERMITVLNLETGGMLYKPKKDFFEKASKGEQDIYKTTNELWKPDEIKQELSNIDGVLDFSDKLREKRAKHAILAYAVTKWSYFLGVILYVLFRVINL